MRIRPLRLALAALALLVAAPAALAALPSAGHVSVINFAFVDAQTGKSITLESGGVTFSWGSGCHTVTTSDHALNSGALCEGATYTPNLAPGVYRYFCSFHSSMTGTLIVSP